MQFPYGISDFQSIIEDGLFYIDRTGMIPVIEQAGRQLIFLRPRRFGKSLWLSTLENYYDIAKKDRFNELFGHLAIGKQPTPLRNSYVVMRWDFSMITATGNADDIETRLNRHINESIDACWEKYAELLNDEHIVYADDAIASFTALVHALNRRSLKLYLLIDEYDNFANELMMGTGDDHYDTLLHGEGAVRGVFKAVKAAASGMGLERVFITGVSPIAMSDITSAYNVAKNIYLREEFNQLCGFTEAEIADVLQQLIEAQDAPRYSLDEVLATMRAFYNGYRFCRRHAERVYNPTLALYFLDVFAAHNRFPDNILDENLAMDRNKIHYIAHMKHGTEVIGKVLDDSRPLLLPAISERFGVRYIGEGQDQVGLLSLLYYLGALTHTDSPLPGEVALHIPNLVMRRLYLEEIRDVCLPGDALDRAAVARALYMQADITPVCRYLESRLFKVFSNRDYRWSDEFTVKTAFLATLFNDVLFIMDSEPELNRGHADLSMIVRPDMRHYAVYNVLMEFKFVKLSDVGMTGADVAGADDEVLHALPAVQQAFTEAGAQLRRYIPCLRARYGESMKLCSFAVVAVGFDRLLWMGGRGQRTEDGGQKEIHNSLVIPPSF